MDALAGTEREFRKPQKAGPARVSGLDICIGNGRDRLFDALSVLSGPIRRFFLDNTRYQCYYWFVEKLITEGRSS
jgi:hypothetical protein